MDINEVRESLRLSITSGNDVPVTRATVKADELIALLADHARLQADADRWCYARTILTIEAIEYAQFNADQANLVGIAASEDENLRADKAIDAAKAVQP